MTLDEATALARFINSETERMEAAACAIGACALVILRDKETQTIPTPVAEPEEYLALMRSASSLVDGSPELRRLLSVWLHRPPRGNEASLEH